MTLLEKIDAVFGWLYINSGNNPALQDITKGLVGKEIDLGEIRDILLKLRKDELIYTEYLGDLNSPYHDNGHFLISFEGKYFYETIGGFAEKARREKIRINSLEAQNKRSERNEERLIKWTRNLFWGNYSSCHWCCWISHMGNMALLSFLVNNIFYEIYS